MVPSWTSMKSEAQPPQPMSSEETSLVFHLH
jgi:hypothetical protein